MSLEYCHECDEPTGHAGELEDSLFLWGHPYCDQCYHDIISDLPDTFERLQAEYKSLQAQLAKEKARVEELEDALNDLLRAKLWKDTIGKDAEYEARRKAAWAKADEVLNRGLSDGTY